ncbi:extracellular solute-binding protein [Pseudarthrobacter sulfonivorans]|uniref:extracellular solute-binding protein n=1 Tax=Pseudarthrobacter sulfonivorans TaxID=121292 RepID=UPI00277F5F39|nr:extracellular solute-binding protein [Pseudarthrobacter sulfonivorans]MDP9999274.1 multiple sugar transport system substrate-binding protein [Pseudarthrobacter sulfonivorans]
MKRFTQATRILSVAALTVMGAGLAACGGGSGGGTGGGSGPAAEAKGPIKIWYSNNEFEVKWGKSMVESWNAAHPEEKIDAQEIPAGKSSEEVIGAAITAGNAPCLVFNTAPVAVPQFQKQGGLVALDEFPDGARYIKDRTGDLADQYKSSDGKMYQLPWKSNPVVLFYNKDIFAKAGLDPESPKLGSHQELLDTARTLVSSGAATTAIWPSPASDFFQSWFDFYSYYAANSDGTPLVKDGKATFDSEQGKQVATMFQTLYKENLASKEVYQGDSFAEGKAAMSMAGPWAIAAYKDKVNWGAVPVPAAQAKAETSTFSDAKNVAMYSACENQGTAWEVMKFATSLEQDGKLLTETGQMPMRQDLPTVYADYFAKNPAYTQFAEQAARTVEVPNVANSVEVWQTFRTAYSKAVIFGNESIDTTFKDAADKINQLVAQK